MSKESWLIAVKNEAYKQTMDDISCCRNEFGKSSTFLANELNDERLLQVRSQNNQCNNCYFLQDFSIWTSDEKLTWNNLISCYTGLYRSSISNKQCSAVCLIECLVRPDVEIKQLMAVVMRTSNSLKYKFSLIQKSFAVLERIEVLPVSSLFELPWSTSSPLSVYKWDHIEIQICVSNEIKHRVILVLFVQNNVTPSTRGDTKHFDQFLNNFKVFCFDFVIVVAHSLV